jgi:hypothetical protein
MLVEFRNVDFRDTKTKARISWSKQDFDLLIRFCMLTCIKKGNPLAEEENLPILYQQAYTLLNIDPERDTVPAMVNSMHTLYTMICSTCFIIGGDMLYEQWSAMKRTWHALNQSLIAGGLDSSEILNVTKNLNNLRTQIETLETALFVSAHHASMAAEEDAIRYYAEANAREWE